MTIKKYTKEDIDKMEDLTDYERVKNMTEDEIRKNAESDVDAPLQTEKELNKFQHVKKPRGTNDGNN